MTIIVTGAAGFIGYHLTAKLLNNGINVVGIDNMNPYYDVALKESRVTQLEQIASSAGAEFNLARIDIESVEDVKTIFNEYKPKKVVNLAAQAGVRYSIENPMAYAQSNIVGFLNILEACRNHQVGHLLYASSSSVYGGNTSMPFTEEQSVDHPVSLYAATKKSNELMAHSYSHLYGLPATGLRFFTVYGPWGRPDMALFLFTKAIKEGKSIKVFNNGNMTRDFTYIDDIIESIYRLLSKPPVSNPNFDKDAPTPATSWAPHRIFNIGNSNTVPLLDYIEAIEDSLGTTAIKEYLPLQPGDVPNTFADTSSLEKCIGFKPATSVQEGVANFVKWYNHYYS